MFAQLHEVVFDLLPLLLPCEKCRRNFQQKIHKVHAACRFGDPKNSEDMFLWLWHLKKEVNKTATVRSGDLTFENLCLRYKCSGGVVDDVALADTLVLTAISAHDLDRDAIFSKFCNVIASILPLPSDSQFAKVLSNMKPQWSVVAQSTRAAKAARIERGLPSLSLKHYRTIADLAS